MHIPDGFLNVPVAISTGLLAGGGLSLAIWRAGRNVPGSRAAILGLSAAFVFAAQMVNFPVLNGTSGHLLGATLAAILLGPSAAAIAMACVIVLQCLMFADGGVTALGANTFNMAIVGAACGYGVYRVILMFSGVRFRPAAAGIAGWISTLLASLACAGQVALSGKVAASLIVPAMLITHSFIGIGEGLITAMVVASLQKLRPELLDAQHQQPASHLVPVIAYGVLISLGLALFISPFACPWPDGLERAAGKLGFDSAAIEPLAPAIFPDYGAKGGWASTALAGGLGTLAVFAIALLLARLLTSRKATRMVPGGSPHKATITQ